MFSSEPPSFFSSFFFAERKERLWAQHPNDRALLSVVLPIFPPPGRVFISYAHRNSASAQGGREAIGIADPHEIAAALRDARIDYFLDTESLNPGDPLMKKLWSELHRCSCVIMCLSPEYNASPNCQKEATYAVMTAKKPILPVIVGTNFEAAWETLPWFLLEHPIAVDATTGFTPELLAKIVRRVEQILE
eukprot:TRINITY_DN14479_c0_g1_i1.p2 TRINITY_DN14479_c0_g1~~TRINITY_DN14479_c0_g1_i1.p2  ORF type:complete len:191 (-),score=34.49 TRINITY_DN14479_c0_g1_i1:103-675(-)